MKPLILQVLDLLKDEHAAYEQLAFEKYGREHKPEECDMCIFIAETEKAQVS